MRGIIVGRRFASIDFPEPGEPMRRMLCAPAAAAVIARLAKSCPFICDMSSSETCSSSAEYGLYSAFFSTAPCFFMNDANTAMFGTP